MTMSSEFYDYEFWVLWLWVLSFMTMSSEFYDYEFYDYKSFMTIRRVL